MLANGTPILLDTNLFKRNPQIEIHPASLQRFPEPLPKGSKGEVIDVLKNGDVFVRFMLRPPRAGEQPFLADNIVNFTIKRAARWVIKEAR
jgi:hypothetical protein